MKPQKPKQPPKQVPVPKPKPRPPLQPGPDDILRDRRRIGSRAFDTRDVFDKAFD